MHSYIVLSTSMLTNMCTLKQNEICIGVVVNVLFEETLNPCSLNWY